MSEQGTPIEVRLGYVFGDRALLEQALTHRSSRFERGGDDNERLELLGDAVVGLATVDWLMKTFPEAGEGELSRLKNRLVSAKLLAEWARAIDLGASLHLGEGEDRSGGRHKRSVLADGIEALLGAIFLEAGFESAREVIETRLQEIGTTPQTGIPLSEAKNRLQEILQGRGSALPSYKLVSESGPAHQRRFAIEVLVDGSALGVGEAGSKKAAEQIAAKHALEALEVLPGAD